MLLFRIFKVLGDESLYFVQKAVTLDAARERAEGLAVLWPGEYVIENEETGERVVISSGSKETN